MEYIKNILSTFLRWFFRHLYTDLAWSYDYVASTVSLGLWNEWVLSVLTDMIRPPILEIGHGPGHLQAALSQLKQQADFHARQLSQAR
ncbi:MAG: hypothetical protein ACK2UW_18520, partial [Anaerolineales bacterium]